MTVKISIPASVIMAGSVGRQTIGSLGSSEDSTNGSLKKPTFSERHPKVVRSLTVVAYIFCVSLAAILLSAYYVVIWTPAKSDDQKASNLNTTHLPCRAVTYIPGADGGSIGYIQQYQHMPSRRYSPYSSLRARPLIIDPPPPLPHPQARQGKTMAMSSSSSHETGSEEGETSYNETDTTDGLDDPQLEVDKEAHVKAPTSTTSSSEIGVTSKTFTTTTNPPATRHIRTGHETGAATTTAAVPSASFPTRQAKVKKLVKRNVSNNLFLSNTPNFNSVILRKLLSSKIVNHEGDKTGSRR